ncbi:Hpt domain-containing protein [Sphingobacterium sp. SYP-B4668]|uniref:Hpt domain-containing protein n=1 Tax=Sphingobacterium sp. SYP-B4668 TaxID=2996035 RepID=UPI0022DD89C6|nr:Hpt domain-containing protein [Sphingobacterium sp. SYP-B4668]
MNIYNLIDPSIIATTMMDNKDTIREFVSLYLSQTPIDISALKSAVALQNYEDIASRAHHIKPTMEYIGAFTLKNKIIEIESLAKNRQGMTDITERFISLEIQIKELYTELQQYLQSLD